VATAAGAIKPAGHYSNSDKENKKKKKKKKLLVAQSRARPRGIVKSSEEWKKRPQPNSVHHTSKVKSKQCEPHQD
jgi:hypothetical protein